MTMKSGTKVALRSPHPSSPAPGVVQPVTEVHAWDANKRLVHARDLESTFFVKWANGALRKHNEAELVELPEEAPPVAPPAESA